jgi:hypothetical protein
MLQRAKNYPSVKALLDDIRKHSDLAFGRFGASLDGEAKLVPIGFHIILLDGDTYFPEILGLPTTKVQEKDFSSFTSGRGRPG